MSSHSGRYWMCTFFASSGRGPDRNGSGSGFGPRGIGSDPTGCDTSTDHHDRSRDIRPRQRPRPSKRSTLWVGTLALASLLKDGPAKARNKPDLPVHLPRAYSGFYHDLVAVSETRLGSRGRLLRKNQLLTRHLPLGPERYGDSCADQRRLTGNTGNSSWIFACYRRGSTAKHRGEEASAQAGTQACKRCLESQSERTCQNTDLTSGHHRKKPPA
jgi:hypothetical protein